MQKQKSNGAKFSEFFFKEIQIFALRLEQISTKVPVTNDVGRALWENIAHIITHTLVQG